MRGIEASACIGVFHLVVSGGVAVGARSKSAISTATPMVVSTDHSASVPTFCSG